MSFLNDHFHLSFIFLLSSFFVLLSGKFAKVFDMFATKEGKCWERIKLWILLSGVFEEDIREFDSVFPLSFHSFLFCFVLFCFCLCLCLFMFVFNL